MARSTDSDPLRRRELDDIDEKILWELSRDGRVSNNALAEMLNLAPSTTSNRLRILREEGFIQSIHAMVDWKAVGLPIQAIIAVRLRIRAELDDYPQKVVRLPWVISVSYLGGPDDFIIHVACTSPEQLRKIVAKHFNSDSAVSSTRTQLVFDHLLGHQHMDHLGGFDEVRGPV